jgi:WXG100 family type VII secretion target
MDFETLYNEIENNIRSMSNNWEGSSAESFYNEFNQLSPSFEAYKLALNEYGEFLNDAADMFESEISRSAATLAH